MPDKIRELKVIFNSFDLKGPKEIIRDALDRFEAETRDFKGEPVCDVALNWMKNIFYQALGDYTGAEDLLDRALRIIESAPEKNLAKWQLKIYLSLGYIHHDQNNFIDAEFFLARALRLADAGDDVKNFLGEIYALLAEVSIHLNQYARAKKYVTRERQAAQDAYREKDAGKGAAVSYAYSLIDFCRIKRTIGLVDHTLSSSLDQALEIFKTHDYTKGTLRAKLESAQLQLVLNFTDKALLIIQEIEPAFYERRMYKEIISAGLLVSKIHKKMLDYGLAEKKLQSLVDLARSKNMSHDLVMSDVYYEMGELCYDTDRETQALERFKSSAKLGMLAGVKRYIFRAFDSARRIDRQSAKIMLSSELVYRDENLVRNRLADRASPFKTSNQKTQLFASTLFVDIAGFSSLMKNSDEHTTVQMIDELIDRICVVIYRNGGYIDKFLGDGFMAIFEHGDQRAPDIALNAVRASMAINRAIHYKNQRFRSVYGLEGDISFRMGLSTGEIFALFLGNFIKREFTYLGNAVNLASKLESRADKKGLLMDDATHDLIRSRVISKAKALDIPGLGQLTAHKFIGLADRSA